MNLKKNLDISLCFVLFTVFMVFNAHGQERSRVVQDRATTQSRESQPTNQNLNPTEVIRKTVSSSPINRPILTNQIAVNHQQVALSLVKKTSSSQPLNAPTYSTSVASGKLFYGAALKSKVMQGINVRLGIPYLYGSTGPNTYDCSGFVWSVFNDAGIYFERSSAKTFWEEFEPVTGDERFQFGTLVFFNKLGHVGIVADEKGFYHASSSKGITYSTFEGYWGKRVVGFRRIPVNQY